MSAATAPMRVDGGIASRGSGQLAERLPNGLGTVLHGGAEAMSAGQRRRLLLARVLMRPAPVVLLDEPTEHLDSADAHLMLAGLLNAADPLLGPGRTVVVATHDPADHIDCPSRLTSVSPAHRTQVQTYPLGYILTPWKTRTRTRAATTALHVHPRCNCGTCIPGSTKT